MQTYHITNIQWDIHPEDLKWSPQPKEEYTVSFNGLTKKDNIRELIDDFLFYLTCYHNFGFDYQWIEETPDSDTFEIWYHYNKEKKTKIS